MATMTKGTRKRRKIICPEGGCTGGRPGAGEGVTVLGGVGSITGIRSGMGSWYCSKGSAARPCRAEAPLVAPIDHSQRGPTMPRRTWREDDLPPVCRIDPNRIRRRALPRQWLIAAILLVGLVGGAAAW